MKNQIKTLVILFLTVTFSAIAGQSTFVSDDEPIVAVYKGFTKEKGFTFTVSEDGAEKELSFPKIDGTILEIVNLKDATLVGEEFELTVHDHEGALHLKELKKIEKKK